MIKVQNKDENHPETSGAFYRGYDISTGAILSDLFSFDTAICVSGLVSLYKETNECAFLDSATLAGEWLVKQMQNNDGSFKALNRPSEPNYVLGKKWFGDKGCLHAKNAICLLKLYDLTRNDKFIESAKSVCDWVLHLQRKDGAFFTREEESFIFSHAHCYATEGLLYAHSKLKTKEYLKAVLKSANWLMRVQNKDGSIMRYHNKFMSTPIKSTDATAQSMRIWLILFKLTGEQRFLESALRSGDWDFLMQMQCRTKTDPNAFVNLKSDTNTKPFLNNHSNGLDHRDVFFSINLTFELFSTYSTEKTMAEFLVQLLPPI